MEQIGGGAVYRGRPVRECCASEHTESGHAEGDNGAEGPWEQPHGLDVRSGPAFRWRPSAFPRHWRAPSCDNLMARYATSRLNIRP